VTNPNDIIDAYDELRRLATILDHDDLRTVVERALLEHRPPALTIVGEQGPEHITFDGDITVEIAQAFDAVNRRLSPIELVGEDKTAGDTGTGITCPWCTADVRPRLLWRHLNSAHREDLHELYAEDGTKGLQDTFGIAYQTAYGWGQRITGEAA